MALRDERVYLRQLRAAMTAEYNLRARLAKVKWEEETLLPALEQAKNEIGTSGSVPQITVDAS